MDSGYDIAVKETREGCENEIKKELTLLLVFIIDFGETYKRISPKKENFRGTFLPIQADVYLRILSNTRLYIVRSKLRYVS